MSPRKKSNNYTDEFILQALKLADELGASQAARDLGIKVNNIYRWRKVLEKDGEHAFRGKGRMTPEAQEIARLRRENADLREERDILKKAATYFASRK